MSIVCVWNETEQVAPVVARDLGLRDGFGLCEAVAIMDGDKTEYLGGIVFHAAVRSTSRFNAAKGEYYCQSVMASIATRSPRWATRAVLREVFSYPFWQLGVERLETMCSRKEKDVRRFNERLGFVQEGCARRAWPHGGDGIVFSMMPWECKWLKGYDSGRQKQ